MKEIRLWDEADGFFYDVLASPRMAFPRRRFGQWLEDPFAGS